MMIWISVAAGLSALTVLALGRFLPPRVEAFLRWVDSYIPGDFSTLHRPVANAAVFTLSALVVTAGAIVIASLAGVNMEGFLQDLSDFGKSSRTWAGTHLPRMAIIIFLAYVAVRVINRSVGTIVHQMLVAQAEKSTLPTEIEKREKTLTGVISGSITLLILAVMGFVLLDELGINITPLLAGAGVVGIAIGFGAQNSVRDLIAGLFIIMEDQYRVGDVVNIAGVGGLVEDINLRRTVLRDLDFTVHIIPNGEVRAVANLTKEKSRVNLNIDVAYKEDLDHCISVLNLVGEEMKADPYWGQFMNEPIKVLRVDNFGESGISIKVLGETQPIRQWDVAGEYRLRVKKAFDKEGIEIPFPHRTIYWGAGQEPYARDMKAGPQTSTREKEDQGRK